MAFVYHKDITDQSELHIPKLHAASHYTGGTDILDWEQIPNLKTYIDAQIAGENFWDMESGNILVPYISNSSINLGSGNILTSGLIDGIDISTIPTTYIKLDQIIPQSIINGNPIFYGIEFDLSPTGQTQSEGRLYWNDEDGTLNLGMPGGNVNLQIGQEHIIRVTNDSGVDIKNGNVVYATGSSGNKVTVALSSCDNTTTLPILGLATEDIDDGHNGYVTLRGTVRGDSSQPINTNGIAEGTKLYLSTSGTWSASFPSSATNAGIRIGIVTNSHLTEGEINVDIHPFTLSNNHNGILRYSIINKSTGTSAGVGFTALNDNSYRATFGIAGSGNTTFGANSGILYFPGYGDTLMAIDGAKSFKWYGDPTDSHNNSSLSYLNMELDYSGNLEVRGDIDTTGEITGELAKVQTSQPSTQVGDLWLDTDADPEYKFGDTSNYTQFNTSSGHQTMVGNAKPYEDLRIEPISRTGVNNPAFEQWFDDSGIGDTGTTRGVYTYTFGNEVVAAEKEIHFTMQMPHAWDGGTLHFHIHWIAKTTAASSAVRWGLEYTMVEPNATFGATASILYASVPISTDTGTTAGKHQITEFTDITPTSSQDGLSTIMIGRIFRNSSHADDTYTGDAGLLYIDCHYQLNSLGSDEEYSK